MNFRPDLAEKVMRGEKTCTRRLVSANPNSPWCGDHIVPRDHGGEDSIDNVSGICRPCNTSKGTRSLLAHLLTRRLDDVLRPLIAERHAALRMGGGGT